MSPASQPVVGSWAQGNVCLRAVCSSVIILCEISALVPVQYGKCPVSRPIVPFVHTFPVLVAITPLKHGLRHRQPLP